jgi:hypothetical protein
VSKSKSSADTSQQTVASDLRERMTRIQRCDRLSSRSEVWVVNLPRIQTAEFQSSTQIVVNTEEVNDTQVWQHRQGRRPSFPDQNDIVRTAPRRGPDDSMVLRGSRTQDFRSDALRRLRFRPYSEDCSYPSLSTLLHQHPTAKSLSAVGPIGRIIPRYSSRGGGASG